MKSPLNVDALTTSRRNILNDALGGISLQMENEVFTKESREALTGIGLTNLEIRLIEEKNNKIGSGQLTVPLSINDINLIENPWKKETYNLTKQIEIRKVDTDLAERLQREANR